MNAAVVSIVVLAASAWLVFLPTVGLLWVVGLLS